jgi:20S proteasome subunit beta 2
MTMLKRYLFRYQGYVSAALVLGGVDVTGAHLYTIYPHGSTDKLPFVSMGSGSLAAMSVLESGFKDDMTEEEAICLVANAIRAGIFNDLGSGSNVDLTILRTPTNGAPAVGAKPMISILRNYDTPNDVTPLRSKVDRPSGRIIPVGASIVLKENFVKAKTAVIDAASMDTN